MNAANVIHQVPAKATSVSKLATTDLKENDRYNLIYVYSSIIIIIIYCVAKNSSGFCLSANLVFFS